MPPTQLEEILQKVQDFVVQELLPLEQLPFAHDWEKMFPVLDQKREKARVAGIWLPQIPAEYGGLGLSLSAFGQVSALLGYSPYGHYVCNCQAPDAGNMEILIEHGNDEQKARFLAPLLEGSIRSCFSMTEPEYAGSNPVMMGSTALKEGAGYRVKGHKWFTTGGHGASFAIVMCLTDPEHPNKYQRASQLIVPADTPGYEHLRRIPIMGDEGFGWASHSEMQYDCYVPASHLLGEEGAGFAIAQHRLGPGRIHHCMRWIGICERAYALMCQRAVDREVAPGKPLASQQTIQNWVAEAKAEIMASRLMVLEVARLIEVQGAYKSRAEISAIKFYVAGVLHKVLDRAIQVHGALGITEHTPLSFWYRHERGARIYDGPDEVHKSTVAKLELRKFGLGKA